MTAEEVIEAVNSALADLAAARSGLERIQGIEQQLIDEIRKRYVKKILELESDIKAGEDRLADLWEKHSDMLRDNPKSKTATLRNGTLSERFGVVAVVIGDTNKVIAYLRKHGVMKRFTRRPEPVVVKSHLKLDPEFVNNAPDDVMRFEQKRTLHIKPLELQVESARNLTSRVVKLRKA